MYEGYNKDEMVCVDPYVNPGAWLLFIHCTHPLCPKMPKIKINKETLKNETLKDFYVKREYLDQGLHFTF